MTSTEPSRGLGEVLRTSDGVDLQFLRSYDVGVEEVWSAIVEPARMERWIGRWSGDPASGEVEFHMTSEEGAPPAPVQVTACEAPRHLAVTMPGPEGAWPVELTLTEDGGRTSLRFVHHLAEPYDASSVGPGWHYYLDRLGAVVAGAPVPDDFDAYYPRLADAYAVPPGPA